VSLPLEHAVEKIRVLVANRPRLMRELVLATISDQPDIEVLGEVTDDSQIARLVAESKPDFVIIALDAPDERPAICDDLLVHHPQVKILALAPERNSSVFFWSVLDIRSTQIESSEEGILSALRGQTRGRNDHHQVVC
jgi:chemotaxis response regulator CheB